MKLALALAFWRWRARRGDDLHKVGFRVGEVALAAVAGVGRLTNQGKNNEQNTFCSFFCACALLLEAHMRKRGPYQLYFCCASWRIETPLQLAVEMRSEEGECAPSI